MRRYCRNVDITDIEFIKGCIWKWLKEKKSRREVQAFLSKYSPYTYREIHTMIDVEDYRFLGETVDRITADCRERILQRKLNLPPIRFRMEYDDVCRKWRKFGIQKPIHQIFDYIAVEGCMEMFCAKIGPYQMASLPERGQDAGVKAIRKWLQTDPNHMRYYGKGDIRQCYPSIDHGRLKAMFARDIKNELLLWLVYELIDVFPEGLSIGSYFSQYACNYFLSRAYHYAGEELAKVRKKRGGGTERVRLIYHELFFMDDFLFLGASKKDVEKAMEGFAAFVKSELLLEVKPDWIVRQADYIGKDGKHHGYFIDMMGRRIYRDHVTLRRKTFKRSWRAVIRAKGYLDAGRPIPLMLARRVTSYAGIFDHTDSDTFERKYNLPKVRSAANKVISRYGKAENEERRVRQDDYYGSALAERARADFNQYTARRAAGGLDPHEYFKGNDAVPF